MGSYTEYLDKNMDFNAITVERKRLLNEIGKKRGNRDVLVMASDLTKSASNSIEYSDILPFQDQLSNLSGEAIDIILKAGGTPVLAHPIQTRGIGKTGSEEFFRNMDKIICGLKKQGLKGVECFHPDQDFDQSMRFIDMAEKYHLHITRGSDFHGKDFADADKTANER